MKKCLVVPLVWLAISFALPTYAQQRDLADPQTIQKFVAMGKAASEAHNNLDAAAFAAIYARNAVFLTPDRPIIGRQAIYARNAVFLTPDRPIIGRQAIQKWFTDFFQSSPLRPQNSMAKFDGNALHVIGTDGNTLWATGEYSEIVQDKNGEPRPVHSYNFWIYVREGEDWKILLDAWGLTPATVIGPGNKIFAPQWAATPSPTASPSTQ
jgi:ketosteroid isomerase-like protein